MIQITYTLVDTLEEAQKIARILVQEKLAACVNILPNLLSVYLWDHKLQESTELGLVIKSAPSQKNTVLKRLKELHPYELPALVSFEAESSPEYTAWVNSSSSLKF